MVFHVGALWRLNEVGLLAKIRRVSSVSGGSITAGALGLFWKDLEFEAGVAKRFDTLVSKVRQMSETSVDVGAVIGGILFPGTISDRVAEAYDEVLYKGATLRNLPDDSTGAAPRFVLNATNVQSSVLWRFSRSYMGDYRVGLVHDPEVPLCKAVAASSAFPPILSPMSLEIKQPVQSTKGADLSRPPFTKTAVLSDGGVYDNLGLETVKRFRTLLVSDAGQKIMPEEDPHHDWARHAIRITRHRGQPSPESTQAPPDRIPTSEATILGPIGAYEPASLITGSKRILSIACIGILFRLPKYPRGWKGCRVCSTTSS